MSKTLKELREKKKLTQDALAAIIGCAPSTIAMYELGERSPTLKRAKSIAKFFGVNLEEIDFGSSAHKAQVS